MGLYTKWQSHLMSLFALVKNYRINLASRSPCDSTQAPLFSIWVLCMSLFVAQIPLIHNSNGPGIRLVEPMPTVRTFCLSSSFCGSTTTPLLVRTKSPQLMRTVSHSPGCFANKRCWCMSVCTMVSLCKFTRYFRPSDLMRSASHA